MLVAEEPCIPHDPAKKQDFNGENLIKESAFDTADNIDDIHLIDKLSKAPPFEEYDNERSINLNLAEEKGEAKANQENFIQKSLKHPIINKLLSLGDGLSALTDHIQTPDLLKDIIDKASFNSTRMIMVSRYLDSARAAFKKKRIVESLGRIMGVVALPLVKLNDLTLASGLGEFIPQLDLALEGKIKEKNELKNLELGEEITTKTEETIWDNAQTWVNSLIEAYKEIFEGGFGDNRKVFPDLNFRQIKKMFSNSLKIMAGGEPDKIENKDQGHTLVFAGTLTFLGSFLGVLFARKSRDLANKIFGSIRSLGGIIADYTLLMHPDKNMKKAGVVTTLGTVIDSIQRFLPEKYINTINHLNLISSTIGSQIISNRSHEKNADNVIVYSDDSLMGALS